MKEALLPYFARRTELTDEEAAAVLAALAADPALRGWLREQLGMDELLSRALQPERADFANRLRAVRGRDGDSERFVARIRDLAGDAATTEAGPSRGGAARGSAGRVRAPGARRRFGAWSAAAAAALALAVTAAWAITTRRPEVNEVLEGRIVVGDEAVRHVPDGSGFTVTGDDPAVIRLGSGSRAQFAPASAATIRADQPASAPVVQLASGSGEFDVGKGHGVRVETSVGTVTGNGEDAQFSAELAKPAAGPDSADGASGPGAAPRSETLEVAVRSGSAKVEFRGKKHIILADEARVFSLGEGKVIEQDLVRGTLRSVTANGPGASLAVAGKDGGLHTIAIGPLTRVRINDLDATAAELRQGDHVEVHVTKDAPLSAALVAVRRSVPKRPVDEPHHLKPGEH